MSARIHLFRLVLAVSIAMTGPPANAVVMLPQNLEQLESQSREIFAGLCTSRTVEIHAQGFPVTRYTFRVVKNVKGVGAAGTTVTLTQFGGEAAGVNGLKTKQTGLPAYEVGQEIVLFICPPSRLGLASPVGFSQGVFPVIRDPRYGAQVHLDPLRRRMLVQGIDRSRYTGNPRYSSTEVLLLTRPPERVSLDVFCSTVNKIAQER